MSEPTVAATILADLARAKGWVCGSAFYASYRPTFSQRISELNREHEAEERALSGVAAHPPLIVSRPCRRDGHAHRGGIYEYALAQYASPEQRRLIA